MKKTIFLAFIMASVLVSCNKKNDENSTNATEKMNNDGMTMEMDSMEMDSMEMDSMKMNHDTKTFACSMHPEVHGKLNDTCHKCGMKLTEPVEK